MKSEKLLSGRCRRFFTRLSVVLAFFIFHFSFFICATAVAQDTLSLGRAREMALEDNRRVEIAELTALKAKYDVRTYRANFLPFFSANAGYFATSAYPYLKFPTLEIPNLDIPPFLQNLGVGLDINNLWFAGIGARQPIYMGGKVRAAYKMARIGSEMAAHNKELTRAEVTVAVDEAYWLHVRALELREAARKYVEVLDELMRNVEGAVETGMRSGSDRLKVEVKRNDAALQLRRAENGVVLSRMNLCSVVGLPLTTEVVVREETSEADVVATEAGKIESRPEYALLERKVLLKRQEMRLTRSDFLPQIGLAASYGYANGFRPTGLWFDGKRTLLDHDAFSAFITASIPLYHWGEGRSKVRSARIGMQIAQAEMDELAEKMELQLAQARFAVDEAFLEVRLAESAAAEAEENLRVSRDHYEAGLETLAGYLEAQAVWQKTLADLAGARATLRLSETAYLKAAGLL